MPSILIHGGSQKTREGRAAKILSEHYIYNLGEEGKRIGIEEVRELLPHIHLLPAKPWSRKGVLITEAQRLNPEAQNALLKTLEEPPSFLTFVLTVSHPRLLLPTVTSRCLIEKAENYAAVDGHEDAQLVNRIFQAKAGERLAIFEDKIGYEQGTISSFLDALEINLAGDRNKNFTQILPLIWRTKKLLQDPSANLKLTVDQFLLSW